MTVGLGQLGKRELARARIRGGEWMTGEKIMTGDGVKGENQLIEIPTDRALSTTVMAVGEVVTVEDRTKPLVRGTVDHLHLLAL